MIVTNKADPHADEVIRRLNTRKIDVFRLNTEDLLDGYSIRLGIDAEGTWSGEIEDRLERKLSLKELAVAWIRRPTFDFEDPSSPIDKFVRSEIKATLDCVFALPNVSFINEPFDATRAKTKFQQLISANAFGIKVPRTIITNSAKLATQFVRESDGDLLIKPVYTSNYDFEGTKQGISSVRITKDQLLDRIDMVANCPTQIQDYIEKQYELRVTVVNQSVFAVKIDSQLNELTKTDWRQLTTLNPHYAVTLPDKIVKFCRDIVYQQKLIVPPSVSNPRL